MNYDPLLSTIDLEFLKNQRVVIDCGHAAICLQQNTILLGDEGYASPSQIATLQLGVALYHYLTALGKCAILSICFTDTSRFLGDPSQRASIRELIENGSMLERLPNEYRQLLSGIEKDNIHFSLQTRNSNRFSALIKRVKAKIKASSSADELFESYRCLFLEKQGAGKTFGFTHPFLLSGQEETQALGGSWWEDESISIHPSDLLKAPLVKLKRLKHINLYDKADGILCPATYGGLLLGFDSSYDHIAVYSRLDDEHSGEKICRGVISAILLKQDTEKNYIQVTLQDEDFCPAHTELSYLNHERIHQGPSCSLETLQNSFATTHHAYS